jgi:glutamyl-tRNA synthetase
MNLNQTSSGAGRFAPTPSSDLHIGNLRTALLAWLFARSSGRAFRVRVEDLDTERCDLQTAERQLADMAAIGLEWDSPVEVQSHHSRRCADAIERLELAGLTYPCFCTRAERAAQAPHGSQGSYSGLCRDLSDADRERFEAEGRKPSLRVRLGDVTVEWNDLMLGASSGVADDPIVRRADGVFAYNLAVVVDDAASCVDQVVRGSDLAHAVPVQAALCDALAIQRPEWAHVPLVVDSNGDRLAKRNAGTTLAELLAVGLSTQQVLAMIGTSLGICAADENVKPETLLNRFDPSALPATPWVFAAPS